MSQFGGVYQQRGLMISVIVEVRGYVNSEWGVCETSTGRVTKDEPMSRKGDCKSRYQLGGVIICGTAEVRRGIFLSITTHALLRGMCRCDREGMQGRSSSPFLLTQHIYDDWLQ